MEGELLPVMTKSRVTPWELGSGYTVEDKILVKKESKELKIQDISKIVCMNIKITKNCDISRNGSNHVIKSSRNEEKQSRGWLDNCNESGQWVICCYQLWKKLGVLEEKRRRNKGLNVTRRIRKDKHLNSWHSSIRDMREINTTTWEGESLSVLEGEPDFN